MKKNLYILGIIMCLIGGYSSIALATTVFYSSQLAPTPSNGRILSTDGTNSSWIVNSGGSGTFPFDSFTGYNATSTTLGFLNGFFSTASSTQIGNFKFLNGYVGIGTTSPVYQLHISSTTAPQLALGSGAGIPMWTFRNAGGYLYISTTTVAGTATTSTAALTLEKDTGKLFSTATSSLYNTNATTTSITSGSISKLAPQDRRFTLTDVGCMVTAATSQAFYITLDGVNNTNTVTCTTTWNYYPLTVNNTGLPGQIPQVVWQTKVGNPGDIIDSINGYKLPN